MSDDFDMDGFRVRLAEFERKLHRQEVMLGHVTADPDTELELYEDECQRKLDLESTLAANRGRLKNSKHRVRPGDAPVVEEEPVSFASVFGAAAEVDGADGGHDGSG